MVGHCKDTWGRRCRDTLRLDTGIFCGWALQGYLVVGRCRDILRLGISVKRCRDIHWLGTAGILDGWALQGYLVVAGILRWLGTAGILCGWAYPLSIAGTLVGH